MEFERLKKSHKKQIIIGALAICVIGGALTFATTRAKYKLTQDIKIVNGTINYKPYDFKIMAMYQENSSGSYTEINTMPSSEYVINESKSYCNLTSGNKDTSAVLKTIDGNHSISNLAKGDRCYLYFDTKKLTIPNIIGSFGNNLKSGTPTFGTIATGAEDVENNGIYQMTDSLYGGTTYYWRGAATTNHVIFANKCWRIIRINGDGSMRLIYNGSQSNKTCAGNGANSGSIAIANQTYNSSNSNSSYAGWTYTVNSQRTLSGTASNAKSQIDSWYNTNITGANATKVADGKFCNDRSVSYGTWAGTETYFYYSGYSRSNSSSVSLYCEAGDTYTLKAGTITRDEAVMAGGGNAANSSYYLYNGQYYWTMTPDQWRSGVSVIYIHSSGTVASTTGSTTNTFGLRPVINLKADTTFTIGGTGTRTNPYIVQ